MAWDAAQPEFAVRKPFPSRTSQAGLVHGRFGKGGPLRVRSSSRMPDNGVIFSDGIEADFLRFTAGMDVCISIADQQGRLAA